VVPVNMRAPGELQAANRVSAHFLSLPVEERDPLLRYQCVRTRTESAKRSHAADGFALMTRMADRLGAPWLTRLGVQLAGALHPYHLIVTNVPGPAFPLYLLGARLVDLHPHLPLFAHQGLGIAALSYSGRIRLGLIADYERIPDLDPLAEDLAAAFGELERASCPAPSPRAPRRPHRVRGDRSGEARRAATRREH
jgi:hypothetical protein